MRIFIRGMSSKVPIHSLPLPTQILTRTLTPDPVIKSPGDFLQVLNTNPSIQRRSRPLAAQSHFSFVSPLPIQFPYRIEPPNPPPPDSERGAYIEKWLSALEPKEEQPSSSPTTYKKFSSPNRNQDRILIGLSETGLQDCLPDLDVGDAFSTLGTPSLSSSVTGTAQSTQEGSAARQDLIDVLSGHTLLVAFDEKSQPTFAPWSLRYSGHQFGVWAGQLGDGRAISVLVTPHPSNPDLSYELQLKGAGRTPFSRSADGLAVVRSSIREFLAAEAMHALGIPTTRSLSLISLPNVEVQRERAESACIASRIAPSFIRLGSFEALNPPANVMLFGGGQQAAHYDALRTLGEWVGQRVLKLEGVTWDEHKSAWGKRLVLEVTQRNAKMVAGWQAYGFMHGVINTDNVSIMGLTIDYGPYAFMDVFDHFHICNHTDAEGRYSYKLQPDSIIFALRSLLRSLAPVIGAESELNGKAVAPGWADNISDDKIREWTNIGKELEPELEALFNTTFKEEYMLLMRKRLGLRTNDSKDETALVISLLNIMEEHRLDFHSTFRRLAFFAPSTIEMESNINEFIDEILKLTPNPERTNSEKAKADFKAWLSTYAKRIEGESAELGTDRDSSRKAEMLKANPRFVLRQWVLEEVIAKVERDPNGGKRLLAKVLQMVCKPFEAWGGEGLPESDLDEEATAERRFCGLGDPKMLGFQCSCSS